MLIGNFILTISLVISIIFSYYIWMQFKRSTGEMLKIDTFSRTDKITLVFEIFANIIMPFPFMVNTTFREYVYVAEVYLDKRVDTIFLTMMYFLRFYHLVRPVLYYSFYMSNRSYRVCKFYGFNCDFMFSIK
jgi:hypothetical protein